MAGRPGSTPCPTPGCLQSQGHSGNCTPQYEPCPTTGCSQRKGHSPPCDANE